VHFIAKKKTQNGLVLRDIQDIARSLRIRDVMLNSWRSLDQPLELPEFPS
jgi:hypothetical protein